MSQTKTLTLTRALTELKTLDRRIENAVKTLEPVSYEANGKLAVHGSVEEFNQKAKSSYESVQSLIAYRTNLKQAVVLANATTQVKVDGKTMTIAEAIDYKHIIEYKTKLLRQLRQAYSETTRRIRNEEEKNEERLQQLLTTSLGSDKNGNNKNTAEVVESLTKSFGSVNQVKIVDPLKIADLIEKLDEEITSFSSDVDAALSEINGKTEITVEV